MLKFGIISEIDALNGLARVYFEEDDYVSAPLKLSVVRSGPDQFSFPFDINEHVWCLMDENCEYGIIGGAIYDEQNKPSESATGKLKLSFADDSTIEYDRNSHILTFDIKGEVNIKCSEANIKAVKTNIDGILNVTGAANIQGVVSVGGLASVTSGPVDASNADISAKSIKATDDVQVSNISLKGHKHTSGSSGSPTSPPTP